MLHLAALLLKKCEMGTRATTMTRQTATHNQKTLITMMLHNSGRRRSDLGSTMVGVHRGQQNEDDESSNDDDDESVLSGDEGGSSSSSRAASDSEDGFSADDDDEDVPIAVPFPNRSNDDSSSSEYCTDESSHGDGESDDDDLEGLVDTRADRYEIRPARRNKDASYDDDSSNTSGSEENAEQRRRKPKPTQRKQRKASDCPKPAADCTKENDAEDASIASDFVDIVVCVDDDEEDDDFDTVEAEVIQNESVEVNMNDASDFIAASDTSHFSPNTSVEAAELFECLGDQSVEESGAATATRMETSSASPDPCSASSPRTDIVCRAKTGPNATSHVDGFPTGNDGTEMAKPIVLERSSASATASTDSDMALAATTSCSSSGIITALQNAKSDGEACLDTTPDDVAVRDGTAVTPSMETGAATPRNESNTPSTASTTGQRTPEDEASATWGNNENEESFDDDDDSMLNVVSVLTPILERSAESESSSQTSPALVEPPTGVEARAVDSIDIVTKQLAAVTFEEQPATSPAATRKQQPLDESLGGAPSVTQDEITRSMKKPTIRREGSIQQGKWKLAKKIGQGAFGVVHLGIDTKSGSFIAVKSARMDPAPMRDAKREIQLLRTLQHPNIVQYIGAEMNRNYLHIFQEWVPAGSLTSLLALLGPFSLPVLQSYLRHILQGLSYLHENNVMHRDIKGSNILVTDKGVVKLADFGAGKQLLGLKTEAMMTMTCRGTPYFMAPEVFEERYSTKADIWSVGCVIVQMTIGSPPWKDLGLSNPVALFRHVSSVEGPPEIPYDALDNTEDVVNHDVKLAELKNIVASCFQKDPHERPNAKELMEDPFVVTDIVWDTDEEHCRRLFSPSPSGKSPSDASSRKTPSPRKPPSYQKRRSSLGPPRSASPLLSSGRKPQTSKASLFSPTMDPTDWPSWAQQTDGFKRKLHKDVSVDSLAYTGSDQGGKENNSMSSTLAGIGFVDLNATTGTK